MSAEQETGELPPPSREPEQEDPTAETLTDLIDRMDREAFRRSLEQRDLRASTVRVQRGARSA
jgi:hypothetical protein